MADAISNISISEWDFLIQDYRKSGLSAPYWCEKHNLKDSKPYWQIRKRKKKNKEKKNIQWVTLEEKVTVTGPSITVKIGKAEIIVTEGFDKKMFAEVVTHHGVSPHSHQPKVNKRLP